MFFSGSPTPRPQQRHEAPAPVEQEGCYFVDFGNVFAEEMQKLLQLRQQGMMCEIVFWQDMGYGF
ncbi:MAG: hypothetical protein QY323_04135 [Patescibacteria group bacterium]|nr:MAG: hypothetical protein QY323_04135 [Patescibacteria group bacterium]